MQREVDGKFPALKLLTIDSLTQKINNRASKKSKLNKKLSQKYHTPKVCHVERNRNICLSIKKDSSASYQ